MNSQFYPKQQRGFTLVELLVVIAIIGILVGLLLPAVSSAIEAGRRAQCMNNLRSFGQGIVNYETSKGKYPGYVANYGFFAGGADPGDPGSGVIAPHAKVGGWGVAILPYIDQQGLWERWSEDRYPVIGGSGELGRDLSGEGFSSLAAPNIPTFQCPSNPVKNGNLGRSSYVTNNGMSHVRAGAAYFDFSASQSRNNGVFNAKYVGVGAPAGYAPGPDVSATDIKDGLSNTILLTENVQALGWHRPGFLDGTNTTGTPPRLTDVTGTDLSWTIELTYSRFVNGFVWHAEDADATTLNAMPAATRPNPPAQLVNALHKINSGGQFGDTGLITLKMNDPSVNAADIARPSSVHTGGIVLSVFADGSTRTLTDSIDYRVYQAIMTPRGKTSNVPFREFVLTDEISQ